MAILGVLKFAGSLAEALAAGSSIERALAQGVTKKLEEIGKEVVLSTIGGPLAVTQRAVSAIQTGGVSELDRSANNFYAQFRPRSFPGESLMRRVGSLLHASGRRPHTPGSWGASSWAQSRSDWLDNHWMHDWRSQPRDVLGRWVPGRLDYIAQQLHYRGKSHHGRLVLRRRKARRLRRLMTKRELRKMLAKGKRDGD